MTDINLTISVALILQLILYVIMCFREGSKPSDFLLLAILTFLVVFYQQHQEIICLLENFPK